MTLPGCTVRLSLQVQRTPCSVASAVAARCGVGCGRRWEGALACAHPPRAVCCLFAPRVRPYYSRLGTSCRGEGSFSSESATDLQERKGRSNQRFQVEPTNPRPGGVSVNISGRGRRVASRFVSDIDVAGARASRAQPRLKLAWNSDFERWRIDPARGARTSRSSGEQEGVHCCASSARPRRSPHRVGASVLRRPRY